MPPDPVLGLLAFLGLLLYAAIGGLAASVTAHVAGNKRQLQLLAGGGGGDVEGVYGGYIAVVFLWPFWLALVAICGALFAVFVGPVWCGLKVAEYTAGALVKETTDAA